MKSTKFQNIINQVRDTVAHGQASLLLQKLEMDYSIKNQEELVNYIVIILALMEQPTYYEQASNLLLRKVMAVDSKIVTDRTHLFNLITENKVMPYIGLSTTYGRLIRTIIYNKNEDSNYIPHFPNREYLTSLNCSILDDYIKEPAQNEKIAINLLYNCVSKIEFPDMRIILDPKGINIFLKKLQSDTFFFGEYLANFFRFYWYGGGSRTHYEGKLIVPEPFFEQIFEGRDNFISFIRTDHSSYNSTMRTLINDILRYFEHSPGPEGLPYDKLGLESSLNYHRNVNEELSRSIY